jgi:hypothetical protein
MFVSKHLTEINLIVYNALKVAFKFHICIYRSNLIKYQKDGRVLPSGI